MDRAFESGAAGSAPVAPGSPSIGYPTPGNPGTGTPATKPGAYWYHMITESLRRVITDAGLTPDHLDITLLSDAIRSLAVVADASTTVSGKVELATALEAQGFVDAFRAITPSTLGSALKGANQSLAINGYQKLPGELILQWGKVGSISVGGSVPVTFPVSFPSVVASIATGLLEQSASDHVKVSIKDLTTSGFSMLGDGTIGTVPGAHWFAIGY